MGSDPEYREAPSLDLTGLAAQLTEQTYRHVLIMPSPGAFDPYHLLPITSPGELDLYHEHRDQDRSLVHSELREVATGAFSQWLQALQPSEEETGRSQRAAGPVHRVIPASGPVTGTLPQGLRPVILVDCRELTATDHAYFATNLYPGYNGFNWLSHQIEVLARLHQTDYTGRRPRVAFVQSADDLSALRKACGDAAVGIVFVGGQPARGAVLPAGVSQVLRAVTGGLRTSARRGRDQRGTRHRTRGSGSELTRET